MTHFPQSRFIADLVSLKGCRKWERLKKNWSRAAARNFGDWRGLSEGTCPQRPVTERKRSQNPKEPLLSFSHPHDYSFSENALAKDNIPGQRSSITPRPGGALEPVLKFKPAYPWLKTVKASHGFFAQKKFANFFQGFYAKSFGNRVKTTLKTMQICPQNHAGYEMSSIYQQKSKRSLCFLGSIRNHFTLNLQLPYSQLLHTAAKRHRIVARLPWLCNNVKSQWKPCKNRTKKGVIE